MPRDTYRPPTGSEAANHPSFAPQASATPRPRSKQRDAIAYGTLITVLVVVLSVALVVGLNPAQNGPPAPAYTVTITGIGLQFTGVTNCLARLLTYPYTVYGVRQFSVTVGLYLSRAYQASSCTIQSVSLSTAGFSLVTANTPLVVTNAANQIGPAILNVTLAPSADYSGGLGFVCPVTSP